MFVYLGANIFEVIPFVDILEIGVNTVDRRPSFR